MQLLEGFSGDGLLLMFTHQQQLQHRPLLVNRIHLMLQYVLRHVYLELKTSAAALELEMDAAALELEMNATALELETDTTALEFESSCVYL
jgi:hypothetical protein